MEKSVLRQIIIDQQELFNREEKIVERDINYDYYLKGDEIVIISGIRRCGKSTLLKIIAKKLKEQTIFINFDDIRLSAFTISDFEKIEQVISELYSPNQKYVLLLDEIQNAEHWERWLNNLYTKGIKVFATGSNAQLLSSEISSYLTGRNKIIRLFPFSLKEYLNYHSIDLSDYPERFTSENKAEIFRHFNNYLNNGGFPVVIKNNDVEITRQYFEDIINKDVLLRYRIREIRELKDLILFLISNPGRIYSYSTLKKVSGLKSLSTIKNYIDYLISVFLLYRIQRFDYSVKKQTVSSSKIYAGDNSFLKTVSFSFSDNTGQKLENLVFLHLIRKGYEVYYHLDKKECDFVIKEGIKITGAIQVSADILDPVVRKREISGLIEAIEKYKLEKGLILTMETEEPELIIDDKRIEIVPVWKWILS